MKTIQINKVLTKHVRYFQVVYPIDLLPSTHKAFIIVIYLNKHYMPCLCLVTVCISDSGLNIFIRNVCLPASSKSWHSCNATQFLGPLTATEYRD